MITVVALTTAVGGIARLEAEVVERVGAQQRDDAERPAGQLDLAHHAAPLDRDDGALEAVARARRARARGAVAQQALDLLGRDHALVADALEVDPPLLLPAPQRVDADAEAGRRRTDAQPRRRDVQRAFLVGRIRPCGVPSLAVAKCARGGLLSSPSP